MHVQNKKSMKAGRSTQSPLHPPLKDPQAIEPRKISREILKNRGLTPHHRKDLKNPRKRQRERHAKAEKRRKGQVMEVKTNTGPYAGEASGIKERVSKSRKLA
jgi:U3 small nucleolar RNA-associated protein 3